MINIFRFNNFNIFVNYFTSNSPEILIVFNLLFALISLWSTVSGIFYIQHILMGHPASILHSMSRAAKILVSSFWFIPLFMAIASVNVVQEFFLKKSIFVLFESMIALIIFLLTIVFPYFKIVFTDGHFSFKQVVALSLKYIKRSFWTLLEMYILTILVSLSLLLILGLLDCFLATPGRS